MRKFEAEEFLRLASLRSAGGAPVLRLVAAHSAAQATTQAERLRSLVKFAISQGYYEIWRKPVDRV